MHPLHPLATPMHSIFRQITEHRDRMNDELLSQFIFSSVTVRDDRKN